MSKVILVTGASSGFGLQTAKVLAQAGHVVYQIPEQSSVACILQAEENSGHGRG